MKCGILYVSLSGNTKKIADAIALELQCECWDLNTLNAQQKEFFWLVHDLDLIIVGTGIYAAHVASDLHKFFIEFKPLKHLHFGLFATWLKWADSGQLTLERFKNYLFKIEQHVIEPFFLCQGKMGMVQSEHPDSYDLVNAQKWAQDIVRRTKLFSAHESHMHTSTI